MRRGVFAAWIGVAVGLVILQSVVHVVVVIGLDRVGTVFDLDTSNGVPDVVSTFALGSAAAGAIVLGRDLHGARRGMTAALAGVLVVLTIADLVHDGPHPSSDLGWLVISAVASAGLLLALLARGFDRRGRVTLAVAIAALVGSFLVNGLDRLSERFDEERGDPIAEYQIVGKEGLELLGWSLVALVLWNEAVRRRRAVATAPASRARAASRRRAA